MPSLPSLPSLISYPNCPNSPINGTYEPGLQVAMRIDTDVCSALYFYCKLSPCAPLSQLRSTLKQRRKLWVFDGGRGRGEVELANVVILQKQCACVCVCVCVCVCLLLSLSVCPGARTSTQFLTFGPVFFSEVAILDRDRESCVSSVGAGRHGGRD